MDAKQEGIVFMSSFSVELDRKRLCRFVFEAHLWDFRLNRFGEATDVLLDTGSFNTIVHESLIKKYGIILNQTMKTRVGGFQGNANVCIIDKIKIGGHVLEKVAALSVPFEGELKDHILLGANVINNWKFLISRLENKMDVMEQFSNDVLQRQ